MRANVTILKIGFWSAIVALVGAVGHIVSVPLQILHVVIPAVIPGGKIARQHPPLTSNSDTVNETGSHARVVILRLAPGRTGWCCQRSARITHCSAPHASTRHAIPV
jgi:hypothetical protein